MRFCVDHWTRLRAAIDARGLGALVVSEGEGVLRETERGPAVIPSGNPRPLPDEPRRRLSVGRFDPLIAATIAISVQVIERCGSTLLRDEPSGVERCPLCYLVATCLCGRGEACRYHDWIDQAADAQLARARDLDLVGIA